MKKVQIFFAFILFITVNAFGQDFGKSLDFNKGEIFFKNDTDSILVKNLGAYLMKTEFFDGAPKSIQFLTDNNKYIIKMIVDDSLLTAKQYLSQVSYFSHEISENVLDNKIVDFYLSSEYFETKLIVEGFDLGKKINFGKDEVYYWKGITLEKANEFGTYLSKVGFFSDDGKIVRIYRDLGILHIAFTILDGYDKKADYIKLVYTFAKQVSDEFADKGKVMIHLTDSHFNDLRIICNF